MRASIALVLVIILTACGKEENSAGSSEKPSTPIISFTYVGEYPHGTDAFTEGLLFHNGKLFESTGATNLPQTRSLFGDVDLKTGAINVKAELDRDKYFGEGIVFFADKIYQLTYRSGTGFVYDAHTFRKTDDFRIPSDEGWGLTADSTSLIMSDGTNVLTFIDPNSLKVVKKISVREDGVALSNLNELEYVEGFVYANVWMTNEIVKIDTRTGKVVGRIDLTPFAEDAKGQYPDSLEMNGIAYNPDSKSFFITGKLWPKIYEFKIKL